VAPAADGPGPAAGVEPAAVLSGPERMIVGFARALRGAGLAVPVGSVLTFTDALGQVGMDRRDRLYWAGRSTLVRRPEDVATFDRVFASFWLGHETFRPLPPVALPVSIAVDDGPEDTEDRDDDPDEGPPAVTVRWSAVEVLRDKDFAAFSPAEWAEMQRLLARLRTNPEVRPARRRRPDRHHRHHPDLRGTVRKALRTGGEPIDRAWRAPVGRPRRVVLLLDISGSMEPYARALLRFAHVTVAARGIARTEVFTLGTRLTRVTRELGDRDPDAALQAAATVVADWSGGTRLGVGLEEFNDRWGTRGTARGAIVVVASDGWDRGEPEQLAEQMQRLARVAHRVVWANPLKASPGYAPLARGMAAALPYVDNFVEGHSLAALERLAAVIGGADHGNTHLGERGALA
jgi:uncharacterized protein with von Willebrand factor type A (vWA) domain